MERSGMAVVTMRQLLEAGVHFGHQTRRWNPKMKRFIFGERNGIYIIDLNQTLQRVDVAYSFVRDLVANGGSVLFVGTKKQSQDPIARSAQLCGMPFVNERWLGGMLTNFTTIALRVKKMQEYERMRAAGDFEAMPKKEALILTRELEKLRAQPRRYTGHGPATRRGVHHRHQEGAHRGVGGQQNGHPDRRRGRHQLRPGPVVQYPIPGNDDAIRSGTFMCRVIQEAVQEGHFVASRRGTGGPGRAARPCTPSSRQRVGRYSLQRRRPSPPRHSPPPHSPMRPSPLRPSRRRWPAPGTCVARPTGRSGASNRRRANAGGRPHDDAVASTDPRPGRSPRANARGTSSVGASWCTGTGRPRSQYPSTRP